jgi:hypothetical protein
MNSNDGRHERPIRAYRLSFRSSFADQINGSFIGGKRSHVRRHADRVLHFTADERNRLAPREVHEGILTISPNVQAVVIPLTALSIFFCAFYFNIRKAKKRVSHWKPGSSYLFIRSNGVLGVKARATRVWIKELGYEEPEALTIARYQECAIVMTFVGVIALFTVLANLVGP